MPKWRSQTAHAHRAQALRLFRVRVRGGDRAREALGAHPPAAAIRADARVRLEVREHHVAERAAKSRGERRRSFQTPNSAEPAAVKEGSFTGVNQRGVG